MLMRMYLRWCERHRFETVLNDHQPGEEAGIKSADFQCLGSSAYGLLSGEIGVHRLVRISPFVRPNGVTPPSQPFLVSPESMRT